MKRLIIFTVFVALLVCLTGCNKQEFQIPANFYYPRAEYAYHTSDGVIAPEVREVYGYHSEKQILAIYLYGPVANSLVNPFPSGTQVVDVVKADNSVCITLSDQFAKLTGAQLMLASASLAKTAMELTGVSFVRLQCSSQPLDGEQFILIDKATILYLDDIATHTERIQ